MVPRTPTAPLLALEDVHVVRNGHRNMPVRAVDGVSLTVAPGETLGLVGESGCGKTSLARAVLQLPPPNAGRVVFSGRELGKLTARALREVRPEIQMVFQDPKASLNPGRSVGKTLETPLRGLRWKDKNQRRAACQKMLEAVGLSPDIYTPRYPVQLSGGQCQRVSIARALMSRPRLLICDEPVSALDVSVQAQILNLLEELKQQLGLTLLFISHDLAVVKRVSDRVAVMYLGKLCELASATEIYARPAHPYTAALLRAIPTPDPAHRLGRKHLLAGDPPSPANPPPGCRFHPRCPRAQARCAAETPQLAEVRPGHQAACHHPLGEVGR